MIASVTSTPAWALWTAFSLSVLGIAMWAFVIIGLRHLIKQYKQTYGPLLSMLLPSAQAEAEPSIQQTDAYVVSAGSPVKSNRCDWQSGVGRCGLTAGHEGIHVVNA